MLTCPADGLWPETVHSTYNLMIPCPTGYSGNMYRTCYANGQWSEVNDRYCGRLHFFAVGSRLVRKQCLPDNDWPLTPSLTTAQKPCPAGFNGTIDRYCGDGVWGETQYNCGACWRRGTDG